MGSTDFKLHIRTEADLADLQATTREINATAAAAQRANRDAQIAANLRQQISRLERQERAEAFARLAPEEQLNQLIAKRAELRRRADQPVIKRSEKVQLAFELAVRGMDQQIAEVRQRMRVFRAKIVADAQREAESVAIAAQREAESVAAAAQKEVQAVGAAQVKMEQGRNRLAAGLQQNVRTTKQRDATELAALPAAERLNELLARRADLQRRIDQPGVTRSEPVQAAFTRHAEKLDQQIEVTRKETLTAPAKAAADAILARDAQAAAAAQAKQEAVDQKLAGRQRELFQLARQQREEAFRQLSPKQQLLALEEKRERLARMLTTAGDNELRRSALLVSQRQTEARIGALQAGRQTLGQRVGGALARGASMLGVPLTVGAVAGLAYYKARAEAQKILAEAQATMDTASRLGVTASRAQEFSFAGRKTGLDEGEQGNILKQLQLAQEKASAGDKGTAGAFKNFGITAKDLANLAPDEIFERMARNAAGANRSTSSMSDAVKLMGRSADKAMGAFRQGFGDAIDEIRAAGGIMDDEVVARLDEAAKSAQLLGVQMKVAFSEFLPDFIAGLQTAFEWAARIANRMSLSGKALSVLALELDYKILKAVAGDNAGPETKRKVEAARQIWVQAQADYARAAEDSDASLAAIDARRVMREQQAAAKRAAIAKKEAEIKTALARLQFERGLDKESGALPSFEGQGTQAAKARLATLKAELTKLQTGKDPEGEAASRHEDAVKELADLQKKNAFERLSDEGKINSLIERRAEIERRLAEARRAGSTSEVDRLLLEQEKLKGSILGLQAKDKLELSRAALKSSPDALQRIGMFRGGRMEVSIRDNMSKAMWLELRRMSRVLERDLNVRIKG